MNHSFSQFKGLEGLYPGEGAYNWEKNAFQNALTENYFNTSLLTILIHTEFVSVQDMFLLY